ncbi:terpene synthase family protein [Nonomuraea rhodomycinica]|uniref:Terpene synthase n=1 Tax=Nonomuraea rhodomycinica TaxID=1712872 RepID=A0A7Y6IY15_9ACTN|nr:terpene synthase family protein [Nonomuraea rhodomycinica]NUW46544.1 hypothetical protein [Nonomuraea rhodomycinica]
MTGTDPQAYFGIRNELADKLLKGADQLAGVPEESRARVLRAALDAVPEAAGPLRAYSALYADGRSSASRLAFSCLSAAATFPDGPRGTIAELGALTAVLFAVDDLADGVADGLATGFAAFFSLLPAALADPSGNPGAGAGAVGEVLDAWRGWAARFRARAGGHTEVLAEQLRLAGAAMARERAWTSGDEPWPSYDDYLANGRITILYPTWWAAALVLCGPRPVRWESVERATLLGASCVRLANDIRTFEREKAEGKPNSIGILQRGGATAEEAVARVAAHIGELETAFHAALAELPQELAGIAEGQRRSVAFNGRWYLARDTHAYTVGELTADTAAHRAP